MMKKPDLLTIKLLNLVEGKEILFWFLSPWAGLL
jgi:hypothetical protein